MLNPADRRLLALVFFLTGATGLVFQIIWTRLLILSFGYTTYSVSTVVATFMGGLALGSLIGGYIADNYKRHILFYAIAEIIVGVFALFATWLLLQFPELMAAARSWMDIPYHGFSIWIVVVSLLVLLPPTILMGATLPLLARAVTRSEGKGGLDISPLYAVNTLGAAAGSLLTGFVALALLGVTKTAILAAGVNIMVGVFAAWYFRAYAVSPSAADSRVATSGDGHLLRSPMIIVFGVSGFASLAAEVAWTRILAPFLESSVYAYSLVVGLFLLGIALGTLVARKKADEHTNAARNFGLAQIAVGVTTLLGLLLLYPFIIEHAQVLPDLGAIVREPDMLLGNSIWFALILLPSTFFMGAGFPFVAQWVSQEFAQLGQRTGKVYAVNTVAAVLGSVLAGFLMIPLLGVKNTLVIAALLSLVFGGWLLWGALPTTQRSRVPLLLAIPVVFAVSAGLQMQEPGRFATQAGYPKKEIVMHQEGIDTAVTLLGNGKQVSSLNIGLRPVSGTSRVLTPWMTHLPMLLEEGEEQVRVLNIGLGVGHTFDVALEYPNSQVTVVELVPGVLEAFKLHRDNAQQLLASDRSKVVIGDGRNYLLNQAENSLEVILVDPTPPLYGAGAVNLYTKDFFDIAKQKLSDKGRLMMRLPYSADSYSIAMVVGTALESFPHVSLWKPGKRGGYSLIASPQARSLPDAETLKQRILSLEHISAEEKAFQVSVQPTLLGVNEQLLQLFPAAPVVTDDRPYLEHPIYFRHWLD